MQTFDPHADHDGIIGDVEPDKTPERVDGELSRMARALILMRENHVEWRGRRRRAAIVIAAIAFVTLDTLSSIAFTAITGKTTTLVMITLVAYGTMIGANIVQPAWKGSSKRHLWAMLADTMLVSAASVVDDLDLGDRIALSTLAGGLDRTQPSIPSSQHLTQTLTVLERVSPNIRPYILAHLHLGLASRGIDLKRLK